MNLLYKMKGKFCAKEKWTLLKMLIHNAPIPEIGEHGSIAPEILGPKNRHLSGEILCVFYLSQNQGFLVLFLLKVCFKTKIF